MADEARAGSLARAEEISWDAVETVVTLGPPEEQPLRGDPPLRVRNWTMGQCRRPGRGLQVVPSLRARSTMRTSAVTHLTAIFAMTLARCT